MTMASPTALLETLSTQCTRNQSAFGLHSADLKGALEHNGCNGLWKWALLLQEVRHCTSGSKLHGQVQFFALEISG